MGDGTRSGVDIGSPVTASDHGSSHTYTLGGTDSGSFTISSSTGQIRSSSGVNDDYEAQSSYSVSVESDDGNSGTETIQVTINLNDVTEKPKEGRVEICAEDPDTSGQYIWGTVCDDYWTDEEAGVVCKALSYHNSEPIGGRFLQSNFGSGTLDFLLDDLLCAGNESSLLDCPVANKTGTAGDHIGANNCRADEAVGVRCLTEAEYTQHVTEVEDDDNSDSPMLSVGDVTVYETPGTKMDFVVTLSGTPTGTVTVNYATQDGTAEAQIDYVPKSGMVTFPLGTTSRTAAGCLGQHEPGRGRRGPGAARCGRSGVEYAWGAGRRRCAAGRTWHPWHIRIERAGRHRIGTAGRWPRVRARRRQFRIRTPGHRRAIPRLRFRRLPVQRRQRAPVADRHLVPVGACGGRRG